MTVFAAETYLVEEESVVQPEVYSEEFPNAYIITENSNSMTSSLSTEPIYNIGSVKATVFVEEEYALSNNEVVIVSSRLLSEDEVMAIGVENFDSYHIPAKEELLGRSSSESRGKLTLNLNAHYEYYGNNGVKCFITGTGNWSTNGTGTSSDYPAVGDDFIGVVWGGDFQATRADGNIDWSINLPIYRISPLHRLLLTLGEYGHFQNIGPQITGLKERLLLRLQLV